MNHIKTILLISFITILIAACSTLKLTPADFGWPIESVLKIDDKGYAHDDRYSISFNTKPLFFEEEQDSMAYTGNSIRLIRNTEGFYFVTAKNFKSVYVFSTDKSALSLENKIPVNEKGFTDPVLNQRPPFIELIDEGTTYKITSEGVEGGKK